MNFAIGGYFDASISLQVSQAVLGTCIVARTHTHTSVNTLVSKCCLAKLRSNGTSSRALNEKQGALQFAMPDLQTPNGSDTLSPPLS